MPSATRRCVRCEMDKPVDQFHGRARTCRPCAAQRDAPKASEADWQRTVEGALTNLGWSWQHVRRTRGRHGEWTTSTSHAGWPDLVALRGALILSIELKSETGSPTDEQLEWLARFARLIGGRAWIVTPVDPEWDTFVRWLRDPEHAPRRHGW